MSNIEQAYEVEKLPGEVSVEICQIQHVPVPGKEGKTRPHIMRKEIKQPAGYMVYCARGHSFRVATLEKLQELGLEPNGAPFVDMETGHVLPKLSLKSRIAR